MGCLPRLLLVLLAALAVAVPTWLLLPAEWVTLVLGRCYAPDQFDLTDPALVASWRLILAAALALVVLVALGLLVGLGRLGRRRRVQAAVPAPLRDLRRALARRDAPAIATAASRVADSLGEEAVPDLEAALAVEALSPEQRRVVAASLYRVGRAVAAEVEHPLGR
jgi:pilus assembly protein TadC